MPQLTFTHGTQVNTTVTAKAGDSVLETALNHDVPLQHACGGFCACTTCHIQVKSGLENLSSMDDDEAERLEAVDGRTEFSRLGCQAKLVRPGTQISVEIMNLDY